jgi:Tol biopolymer transport system component
VRQLTTHPHVDTFPRLSPDGRRVLFARSQTPWVSQRNPVPWDTYVLDLESGRERLVATNAYSATWGADGTTVCFQRNSDRIVLRDLRSGAERVVFQAGQGLIPAGVQLQAPSLGSRDGALAATFRGAHRAAVAVCRDRIVPIARSGCQMVWTPDQAGLGYVDAGERQKNAIYHYDWKAGTKRPWLDMIGEFSHEYFPQVSRDSRYLVLGASRGGRGDHEHDTGDYEIFLWKIGNPPDRVARLTFHSGNDCWPDIFLQ